MLFQNFPSPYNKQLGHLSTPSLTTKRDKIIKRHPGISWNIQASMNILDLHGRSMSVHAGPIFSPCPQRTNSMDLHGA